MPQLDKFAFAPQIFWLVLAFFVLYLLILRDGLSVLHRVLLFRRKTIQLLSTRVVVFVVESSVLQMSVTKVLTGFLVSRFVADSFTKLVELFANRAGSQLNILAAVRTDLVAKSFSPLFVGSKQGLLPLIGDFSSLKVIL